MKKLHGFHEPAFTVAELRERLAAFPQDMPVLTEGCDCYGVAAGISTHSDFVLISRANEPDPSLGAPI